jgi:hypothetical protein
MECPMHSEDRLHEIGRRRDQLISQFSARLTDGDDYNARLARAGLEHLDRIAAVMQAYDGSVPNPRFRDACIDLAEVDLTLAEDLLEFRLPKTC